MDSDVAERRQQVAIEPDQARSTWRERASSRAVRRTLRAGSVSTGLFLAMLVAIILVWHLIKETTDIKAYILPWPRSVWQQLRTGLTSSNPTLSWWTHVIATAEETALGFLIGSAVGFLLGVMLGLSRFMSRLARPYIVAFQAVPKAALGPTLILWLGFGQSSKVALAAMLAFFTVMVNTEYGIMSTEPGYMELMRSIGAGRWQAFRWARLPGALPMVFAGLEIASMHALLGAVVGELLGAQKGLGVLLLTASQRPDAGETFALFVTLAVIGIAILQIVRLVGRRLTYWSPSVRNQTLNTAA